MALTKKAANDKYDRLKERLERGEITKERFKQAADRIYKMYHSDENKATRNAKPAIKAKPAASKPRQTTQAEAKERFFRSSSQGSIAQNQEKARRNFFRSSSGTRGQYRPSNSPGPAVVRPGSRTGASVDPRERQLRKNRQEAARRRLRGSTNRRGRRS